MKSYFYIFISFFISRQVIGQTNLVPNWSFEIQTSCPNNNSQFYLVVNWFSPTGTSTDLFDSCSAQANVPWSQGPFYSPIYSMSGHAYIGMHQYSEGNREYAQVKLTKALSSNECYYAEFFTRVCGISPQAINNMGINFSSTSYTNYPSGPPIVVPTHITRFGNPIIRDTLDWVKVSGIYNATGNEEYLTIGNFNIGANTDTSSWHPTTPFANSSYYFVDAVSVYSIDPQGTLPWSYNDTTVFIGDSVFIGNYLGGSFNPSWHTYNGSLIANSAGIYVKPLISSQYIVQYTVCNVPRSDTILVTVLSSVGQDELPFNHMDVEIVPNPSDGFIQISILNPDISLGNSVVKITNVLGHEVGQIDLETNRQKFDLSYLSAGVYYLTFYTNRNKLTKRLVVH